MLETLYQDDRSLIYADSDWKKFREKALDGTRVFLNKFSGENSRDNLQINFFKRK